MNTKITTYPDTIKNLTAWLDNLKELAKQDTEKTLHWFGQTAGQPFCIVGGWMGGIPESYSDLFCMSKSNPTYAMCVKIAVNDDKDHLDFESIEMPVSTSGEIEDLCIALEQEDDTEELAAFLLCEWERIMSEQKEES